MKEEMGICAALTERHEGAGRHVTSSGLRWRRIVESGEGRHPEPFDRVEPTV